MNLPAIQAALRERNIDAWLFYDHHHRDPIAYRVLGLPSSLMVTRRWFYLIPAQGEPAKLVHRIEAGHLDPLPGSKDVYSGWQELWDKLRTMVSSHTTLAMQYSPNNLIPYVGLVDAGTVELVRGFGNTIVSSADLVARFEAVWSEEQVASHFAARDAPIVLDPADSTVPEAVRRLLEQVARSYGLVACISGRRALEARAAADATKRPEQRDWSLGRVTAAAAEPPLALVRLAADLGELCGAAGPRVELRVHADVAAAAAIAAGVARGARGLVATNLTALPGDARIEEADRLVAVAEAASETLRVS